MLEEFRPVQEALIDLCEGARVVFRELDALPELAGHVCALGGFHVEVEDAVFGADGGVAGVGEGAGRAVAKSGDVVFIAAKVLSLGSLNLEGAELLVDDVPDNFVGRHCRSVLGGSEK